MANAGSALMGIGRASGENRAIQAAQQAIDSPLLEVSIDGARGILFNVIGGNDLSMHEINTAAETITAASDPEANIIFGATINPELEGEMIITVVATGFDAAYYAKRSAASELGLGASTTATARPTTTAMDDIRDTHTTAPVSGGSDDSVMSGIDMNLDEHNDESFTSDTPMPNIWTIDDGSQDSADNIGSDDNDSYHVGQHDDTPEEGLRGNGLSGQPGELSREAREQMALHEDELERPSFLRRLRNRKKSDDNK
jgi:hypothetical protein